MITHTTGMNHLKTIIRSLLLHTNITHQPVTFPWAAGWTNAVIDSNPSTEKTLEWVGPAANAVSQCCNAFPRGHIGLNVKMTTLSSRAEAKNAWSYTTTPPYAFVAHTLYLGGPTCWQCTFRAVHIRQIAGYRSPTL